ncbi:MAG: SDR family oxidoreductase, partial [Catenulispora sp.]|nr:SDR family oxidoreductase [Catenulispora sp.]
KALRPDAAEDAHRQPALRTGRRHEIGWAATYLCSPFAAFLTGHTLVVDGGNHLRRDFVMPTVTPIREQLPPRG